MAEELQSLLDRIRTEGVDKAQAQADAILADARKKADEMVAEAQKKADELRKQAEADAAVLQLRSEQSIKQAARDVVLGVGQSAQEMLERVLAQDVKNQLTGEFLGSFLQSIVATIGCSDFEVRVAPAQAEALAAYAKAKFADAVKGGMKIAPDRDVTAGISVRMQGGRIESDFTDKAVMEAMRGILRPSLAKLVFGE